MGKKGESDTQRRDEEKHSMIQDPQQERDGGSVTPRFVPAVSKAASSLSSNALYAAQQA